MKILSGFQRQPIPLAYRRAAFLFIAVLLVIWAGFLGLSNQVRRTEYLDVISPLIDLLACVLVFAAAMRSMAHSRRIALAWLTFAIAGLLYAAGDTIWAVRELLLDVPVFPSIGDAFYLAYYPAFLLGVLLLIQKPVSAIERLNNTLDLAIIFIAAILGFGNFLIYPIIRSSLGAPWLEQVILVAYPVADLVLLAALLLIVYNDPDPEGMQPVVQPAIPIFFLAVGMLIMIVSDCIYSYQTIQGTYSSGGALDFGWLIGNLVVGMAAVAQWINMQPGSVVASYSPGRVFHSHVRWVKTYLPYLWLMGAFALLVISALTPLPMAFTSIALGVALILGLVLLRQVATLSANEQLNIRLKEQAGRLESINSDLNAEIAERLRVQDQLAFDVLHDQMTGLANRRLFLDRLEQAIIRSKRHTGVSFGVLFMDLDQFKVINDSLGHGLGDELLIAVSRRLTDTVRAGDTVARFGGDEFAVLLDDLDQENSARRVARKIQDAIAVPFCLQDRDVHASASIGIATDVLKYEHAEDLLRDVDLAMYQAKALGKARSVMFTLDMRDQAFSRLAMEDGLRNGLTNGEFQLHYQPITSLESDRVVGLEALLRWCHPTQGLLLPLEFLSVAEDSDLILPIGEWVLNEACRQLKTWVSPQAVSAAPGIASE